MRRRVTYLVVACLVGVCFVVVGALAREMVAGAFGAALAVGSVVVLVNKRLYSSNPRQTRFSLIALAGLGASFALIGFGHGRYAMGAVGAVILIGALFRWHFPQVR